ncbi:DUF1254 domain-containing protein [Criblamydia sequanensis]|uniref:Conserved putative secreted protein n=1 Tax=Candidatus Criblamydia sequanensis CRIB-18 TaxID=1437425 RepID=A0A090D146_9BACT|nr:DUF1254 domain-containing protein [Criblamydia sequanensis]CDR33323.1 Conserved putative secreted protein [Criblamydia sequanensis CRIB-18]
MKNFIYILLALLLTSLLFSFWKKEDLDKNKNSEELAEKAYIYGYPLVLMDTTEKILTATAAPDGAKAPVNQIVNIRAFPNPEMQDVVSPNADTLYTSGWLDLTKEPMVFSVPDTFDRYYLIQLLDAWTDVLSPIGTTHTGNKKGSFAITGPEWKGNLPEGVKQIKSPTNTVWLIGRVLTKGPADYAAVHKIQDQFSLKPLSFYGKDYTPPARVPIDPYVDVKTPPVAQVDNLEGITFFRRLNELMEGSPPSLKDEAFLKQLEEIGIGRGKKFDPKNFSKERLTELQKGVDEAKLKIKEAWKNQSFSKKVNGWVMPSTKVGQYGTDYFFRAVIAYGALGANLAEDAFYPLTNVDDKGEPLIGKNAYKIHFEKDKLPPVEAFWSITLYNDRQFFVKNPINRYSLGDRSGLKFNEDGSLDIYIQNTSPGKEKESNWLPSPTGLFNLILRLYQPKKEVLEGSWKPPSVQKVN